MRTDEERKADVVKQLTWDERVDASSVAVEVDQGVVTLAGTVATHTARRAAVEGARQARGVTAVKDELRVDDRSAAVSPASDAELLAEVQRGLALSPSLHGHKIRASVANGWVTLEGSVDAYWKKVHAENKATDLWGVMGVINKVAVVPTESVSDEAIAENVVDAIERNANVRLEHIEVTVVDGHVTLDGVVPNGVAQVAAHNAALHTHGVKEVDDRLVVSFQM